MTNLYDNIPVELTELDNWCVYRKEWVSERGKFTKIPYNPLTKEHAKSNDKNTWVSFDDAVDNIGGFDGLGFFFDGDYYGVDLDNCESEIIRYNEKDYEDNKVADFIETLTSYAELSPSGKGVHIICKGTLPPGGRRNGEVEMYNNGRFFTMTGNRIGDYKGIFDDTNIGKINYLHHKYIGEKHIDVKSIVAVSTGGNDLTTDEIIEHALESKNGMRFKLFLDGEWNQFYPSQSEADIAFANDLAYWCAKDFEKMDAIYRLSKMMRPKWDSKRENSTYGQITLNKAILTATNVFIPFSVKFAEGALKTTPRKPIRAHSYDDMGNVERFIDGYGENVLYSYINKTWYYYADKYWIEDNLGKVHQMADNVSELIKQEPIIVSDPNDDKLVEKAKENKQKHIKYTRSYRGKDNMLRDLQHHVAILPDEFDNDGMLFNTQNGYIDLTNGHLMKHEKSKRFTRISHTEFRPEQECPRWLSFLDETFEGNQDLIDYLQRAVGYSMCSQTVEQVMFILLGNGKNGKSVLLSALNDIFGSYAMNIQPTTIAVKSGNQSANSDIARLQGARFVTTTEPNQGMKLDEGTVKQITGGDVVTARFLYGKEFEYKPEFKLWMATNYKPVISGTDEGIWRRISIIPFNRLVPEDKVDLRLPYKLKEELGGILNWCVEGFKKWRERGLDEPLIIKQQRSEYRTEMDVVARFIEENCEVRPSATISASELYKQYREWSKENGEYDGLSNTKFGIEMSKKFKKEKKATGRVYLGLTLKNKPYAVYVKNA